MQDPLPITPVGPFDLEVRPPGSKSLLHRAAVAAALAEGESVLTGVDPSEDVVRTLSALHKLGAKVEFNPDTREARIQGAGGTLPGGVTTDPIDLGASGTSYRLIAAAACVAQGVHTLDGTARMRQRPIGPLVDALRELGAEIDYLGQRGYPPLKITGGTIQGGKVKLRDLVSSQFLSALLLIGPGCPEGLALTFEGDTPSMPYVRMTVKVMEHFRVRPTSKESSRSGRVRLTVSPDAYYVGRPFDIEPDASGASYFLGAGALVPGSRVVVPGLGSESVQGDAHFADLLGRMGAHVEQRWDRTLVEAPASGMLRGIDVDLNGMPDMAQTLAVLALFAEGETHLRNIGHLRVKETDRLDAIANEVGRLGGDTFILGDDLTVTPPGPDGFTCSADKPVVIQTYDDHRMAMAFSLAGLRIPGVQIQDPGCVAKSYPRYYEDWARLSEGAVDAAGTGG
ncbi:MAG: 3-phosphoshikimate 1-carboxyvinyltransferase [Planctomycetota bacterium]